MKKMIALCFISILFVGCVAGDLTSSAFNKTGSFVSNAMSGGKIHITVGIESDAAYNNEVKE